MKTVRGWARVAFYAELPDNDAEADDAFERICDDIASRLNEREVAYAAEGSFSVEDGDTEPDE